MSNKEKETDLTLTAEELHRVCVGLRLHARTLNSVISYGMERGLEDSVRTWTGEQKEVKALEKRLAAILEDLREGKAIQVVEGASNA